MYPSHHTGLLDVRVDGESPGEIGGKFALIGNGGYDYLRQELEMSTRHEEEYLSGNWLDFSIYALKFKRKILHIWMTSRESSMQSEGMANLLRSEGSDSIPCIDRLWALSVRRSISSRLGCMWPRLTKARSERGKDSWGSIPEELRDWGRSNLYRKRLVSIIDWISWRRAVECVSSGRSRSNRRPYESSNALKESLWNLYRKCLSTNS